MKNLEPLKATAYKPGIRYICPLSGDVDLIASITALCTQEKVDAASFSIMGSIFSATIGVFDPKQQVFVTHIEKTANEILSCTGFVSRKSGDYELQATILLADQQGRTTGGRLFAETIIAAAELHIQTLLKA